MALHGEYYSLEWGLGADFEAQVASGIADFFERKGEHAQTAWFALVDDRIEGAIFLDDVSGDMRLRWFILSENTKGQGVGRLLMQAAMGYCDERDLNRVYLTTFAGLDAARYLYESFGFRLVTEGVDHTWGKPMPEQLFERRRH